MANLLRLKAFLNEKLGPLYYIEFNPKNYLIVNSPITNEIGDNYRIFIHAIDETYKDYGKYMYVIDDDGDAIDEFKINNLQTFNAYQYITDNHGLIDDDMIVLHSQENNVIETIFKHLRLQAGLTALQDFAERNHE